MLVTPIVKNCHFTAVGTEDQGHGGMGEGDAGEGVGWGEEDGASLESSLPPQVGPLSPKLNSAELLGVTQLWAAERTPWLFSLPSSPLPFLLRFIKV